MAPDPIKQLSLKAEWNNLSGLYQPESITIKYGISIGSPCNNTYVLSSSNNWITNSFPGLYICDILFDTINHYDYTISTVNATITIVFTEKEESIQTDNKIKPLVIDKSIDLIYKKGNYLNTYLIADIIGLPDNATLSLTDAQNNQLYSPFDVNGNYEKTACTAETTNTKIAIPLPAQYNGDLWTDYPTGTYNWKLCYHGDDLYEAKDYPLVIQIVDFNTWEVQNPSIYPNEDISAKIRTYANTIPSVTDLLTANATYNANTGIITYPNNDINDLSVGEHTQLINNKQLLEYTVENPIEFYIDGDGVNTNYNPSITSSYCNIGCKIKDGCGLTTKPSTLKVQINNKIYNGYDFYPTTHSDILVTNNYSANNSEPLPPNTYMCKASVELSDNTRYYCDGSFYINTENCSIALSSLLDNEYEYTSQPTEWTGDSGINMGNSISGTGYVNIPSPDMDFYNYFYIYINDTTNMPMIYRLYDSLDIDISDLNIPDGIYADLEFFINGNEVTVVCNTLSQTYPLSDCDYNTTNIFTIYFSDDQILDSPIVTIKQINKLGTYIKSIPYQIQYLYDLSDPIANAKVALINDDNEIIQTSTTDSNGHAIVNVLSAGKYRPVALNIYEEHILIGEVYEVKNI